MQLTFHGAAGGVTGSRHLVEVEGKRILLDCGTFQGSRSQRKRNRDFAFDPRSIDAVVLSHAHIDHCGMLPLLVKRGFAGKIWATPATCDVAELMLEDMGRIEFQDAQYRRKHGYGSPEEQEPLYTLDDVQTAVERFAPVKYARFVDGWTEIVEGVRLKFYDAGHILGSAVSVLEFDGHDKRLGYTGDLGATGMPLLYDPQVPKEEVEVLLTETTYGSRQHESLADSVERLAAAVREIVERGGKIIVPAFSLGRTQAFVYLLHKLTDEKRIPRFPIFVDSPLATNLTEVYRQHRQNYDEETWADFGHEEDGPLAFRNLTYTASVDESKALNGRPGPFMIVSASGMMVAGRVVHHLRNCLEDPKNAVFITGYQAQGTMGRKILEGAQEVEIFGQRKQVKADIFLFNEFSAHADREQLQTYLESVPGLEQLFLVHGEPHQADDFKTQLAGSHPEWKVVRPDEGDSFSL